MKKLVVSVLLVLAAGCGKSGLDAKLDDLDKIKDEMCACKDKKCADDTQEKYITWKKGNSKEDKPSKEQDERYEKIKSEMHKCKADAK